MAINSATEAKKMDVSSKLDTAAHAVPAAEGAAMNKNSVG
eukprot:CAMPEP_0167782930 /NCGR_PEP_ID=MMETSP0111_2-20121227/6794_1 /TAXON_ID=91324 /ORGANISM="Lotharella globosa, Strain CCCM811" /LENGTH=39 /DNA_ID= /DNA_START= /DNA_END= /DNA_ORIENTATION=